jgi:hypothetical protein
VDTELKKGKKFIEHKTTLQCRYLTQGGGKGQKKKKKKRGKKKQKKTPFLMARTTLAVNETSLINLNEVNTPK